MFSNKYVLYFIVLLGTFLATTLILYKLIPFLMSKKMGAKILEIGPRWHKSKEGTPTMGGIAFGIACFVFGVTACIGLSLNYGLKDNLDLIYTLIFAFANFALGFIDDYTKFKKKENIGLKDLQKLIPQIVLSGLYLFALSTVRPNLTITFIPFLNIEVDLGIWYYILGMLILVGFLNAVNITDGIDGLCSSVTMIVGIFFSIYAFVYLGGYFMPKLAVMGALLVGSCAGFLVYNFHPAKVFMGDTGSLFLGAMVCGAAFLVDEPLIILVVGIIYLIEVVSDIIQLIAIYGFNTKVFKMAPIHHHFEQCGWSEIKIVSVASIITVIAVVLAFCFGINC